MNKYSKIGILVLVVVVLAIVLGITVSRAQPATYWGCVQGGHSEVECWEGYMHLLAHERGELGYCAEAGALREFCAMQVTVVRALAQEDGEYCAQLGQETLIDRCTDLYALRRAEDTDDEEWCNKVGREDLRQQCTEVLMARRTDAVTSEEVSISDTATFPNAKLCLALEPEAQGRCLLLTEERDQELVEEWCTRWGAEGWLGMIVENGDQRMVDRRELCISTSL